MLKALSRSWEFAKLGFRTVLDHKLLILVLLPNPDKNGSIPGWTAKTLQRF